MYQHPYVLQNQWQYPITYQSSFRARQTTPVSYYPYHQTMNYQSTYYPQKRQYPEVDPTLFNESAKQMQTLMNEASLVLKKIAESKSFAKKIMSAAQESHLNEVERLIKSTGIKSNVDTTFNPDGFNMKLSSKVDETDCCQLTIALKWRRS